MEKMASKTALGMAKLIDDMVRRPEYDLDPLPFFDGTFYLIGDNGEPLKNTNG